MICNIFSIKKLIEQVQRSLKPIYLIMSNFEWKITSSINKVNLAFFCKRGTQNYIKIRRSNMTFLLN